MCFNYYYCYFFYYFIKKNYNYVIDNMLINIFNLKDIIYEMAINRKFVVFVYPYLLCK